jgi:hypothetical protein
MPPLSPEWLYWSLVNGVPALVATILFLVYPPFAWRFAWDVEHRQSAIFLGTGFLLRAALFVHVITARSWGEIRWITLGNGVFAAVLLGVTLVYGDYFKWRRLVAIIWLFLYIEEPVWMLSLVPQAQAAAGTAVLPGPEVNGLLRVALWVEAAIMLAAGIYLFFLDKFQTQLWPWQPDLVSHRIMAGWPLAWAAWAPTLALAPSWPEARGGVLLNIIWLGAMLISLVVFRSTFNLSQRRTQIYGAVIALLFIVLLLGFVLQG